MAERAALVHEDVVIVVLPIKFLNDLLGQEDELVSLRAFVITLLLQLFPAFLVHQCATFVVSLELFYSLCDILTPSVLEGTVKGNFESWNGLNLKYRRASIGTGSFLIPGPGHALETEHFMAGPTAPYHIL